MIDAIIARTDGGTCSNCGAQLRAGDLIRRMTGLKPDWSSCETLAHEHTVDLLMCPACITEAERACKTAMREHLSLELSEIHRLIGNIAPMSEN